jgi:CRISPR-associated protein Cmr6
MYLPLWGINRRTHDLLWKTHDVGYEVRGPNQQEREVKYENKVSALKAATRLSNADKQLIASLLMRQTAAFGAAPSAHGKISLPAIAIAPFTTGLGNEHPLENGFAFLNPYGLPYLPGSGVKGVLRQAVRELASGDWGASPWRESNRSLSEVETNAAARDTAQSVNDLDALFGREDSNNALRGALSFWDVIPQIKGDSLMVEIMTPHQGHYYQQKPAAGSTSPHDSGQRPSPSATSPCRPGPALPSMWSATWPTLDGSLLNWRGTAAGKPSSPPPSSTLSPGAALAPRRRWDMGRWCVTTLPRKPR